MDNPNRTHVGMSAVRTAIKRLQPDVSAVSARAQGSTDPNAPWSKARYNQFQQFRLRLGRQRFRELPVIDQLKPCLQNLADHKLKV